MRRAAQVLATGALVALATGSGAGAVQDAQRDPHAPRLAIEPVGDAPDAPKAFVVLDLPNAVRETAAARPPSHEEWRAVLSVHVEREDRAAILGRYRLDELGLWLVPAFPPEPGVRYRAVFRPAALAGMPEGATAEPLTADLRLDPPPPPPATAVLAVHPDTDDVPENLLRFYVHFAAPMSRGDVHRFVRLESASGREIERAFLELDEELWDRAGRRLTLLLDPGRVKSGLRPREEEGRALEAGRDVALAIDAGLLDAAGRPLAAPWRRTFRVGAADRDPPDPSRWRIAPPPAGTRDPLRVVLDEALDHALLHRMIWIEDASGLDVAGTPEIGPAERSWIFTPDAEWRPGGYDLRVDRRLEDRAGNRVGRPFEVDLAAPRVDSGEGDDQEPVTLPFAIAP